MKPRHRSLLAVVALVLLAACRPAEQLLTRLGAAIGPNSAPALPQPSASPTPPRAGVPQVAILGDLLVDSAGGRLYASALVNGLPQLAVLNAADGSLLAAWDTPGAPALDAARGRLAVDRGNLGLAFLDATTGAEATTLALPPQDVPASPQVDPRTGRFYAFRGASVYAIDPIVGRVVDTLSVTVVRTVCDQPAGDATIDRSAFDAQTGTLYLAFLSRTCVPWANLTLVAVDTVAWREMGRSDVEVRSQFAAYDGALYGVTVSRLGPTLYWRWAGQERQEEMADYQGGPAGVVIDPGRGLVYQAVGEAIHLVRSDDSGATSRVVVPLLADSRLTAYDPATDMLYFVSPAGRLTLWPAAGLHGAPSPPIAAPSSLPDAPVTALALSPDWTNDATIAALLDNGDCPVAGSRLFVLLGLSGWQPGELRGDGACDAIAAVAFSPAYADDSLLFVAANDPLSVLRSVDGGRSWAAAETPFPAGTTFRSLILSPAYAADQTLFVLTDAGELYRSRDGGRRWQRLDQRLDRIALASAPGSALDLLGARGGTIYRSQTGDTWERSGSTPDGEPLELLAAAPTGGSWPALYVFTTGGRFARSLDGGTTWSPVLETSPGPAQLALAAEIPGDARPVFLLYERQVAASYDGLASIWAATAVDQAVAYRPTAIALPPDFAAAPYLFVGTVDGEVLRVRADAQP